MRGVRPALEKALKVVLLLLSLALFCNNASHLLLFN